jgi:hypothetical protein
MASPLSSTIIAAIGPDPATVWPCSSVTPTPAILCTKVIGYAGILHQKLYGMSVQVHSSDSFAINYHGCSAGRGNAYAEHCRYSSLCAFAVLRARVVE